MVLYPVIPDCSWSTNEYGLFARQKANPLNIPFRSQNTPCQKLGEQVKSFFSCAVYCSLLTCLWTRQGLRHSIKSACTVRRAWLFSIHWNGRRYIWRLIQPMKVKLAGEWLCLVYRDGWREMIFQWARNFQLIALVGYKSSLNNLSNSFHLLSWRTREIPKHLWEVKGLRSPTQYLWLVPFPSSGTSSQMLEQSRNEWLDQSRMGYLPSSSCGLPKQRFYSWDVFRSRD